MIRKMRLLSAIALVSCLSLPFSGSYVDGPLITELKPSFMWDGFNSRHLYDWLLLFAFIWPLPIVCVEVRWHHQPFLLSVVQIVEIVGTFYS